MKKTKFGSRYAVLREGYLKKIRGVGPFVEGTLVRLSKPGSAHVAHRLTFKVKGKTKAVYVPVDLVEDVEEWTRNYKELKGLIRKVTKQSLALLQRHVRVKRAVQKGKRTIKAR